jgi:hypothetical protein
MLPPSSFGRERVVAVAVALADATVLAVDKQLKMLVLCDAATCRDRLSLRPMN